MKSERLRARRSHELRSVSLFRRVPSPTIAKLAPSTWYTWSDTFRHQLVRWADAVENIAEPELVHRKGSIPYGYSFDIDPGVIKNASLRSEMMRAARSLYRMPVPSEIMFLTDLCFDMFRFRHLHLLFAFFRHILAKWSGDPLIAMCTPLGDTGPYIGGFPLHCDLYRGEILWNVFHNVPADKSGASTFLRVSILKQLLGRKSSVPADIIECISSALDRPLSTDRFDEIYDILHGLGHPWVKSLEREMVAEQARFSFCRGQGYMLHDRTWLHGRESMSKGVPEDRLLRLIFNNYSLDQARRRYLSPK